MRSLLAIVSLSFSAANYLCRHSSRLFVTCPALQKECYLLYHAFPCSLSLPLYVLDDDVFSSPFITHFLVLGQSPFPSSRLHTLSVESLSPFADWDSFIHRESSQERGLLISSGKPITIVIVLNLLPHNYASRI
jgi:hypothetical protein